MSGMYIEVLADTNPPFERIPPPQKSSRYCTITLSEKMTSKMIGH